MYGVFKYFFIYWGLFLFVCSNVKIEFEQVYKINDKLYSTEAVSLDDLNPNTSHNLLMSEVRQRDLYRQFLKNFYSTCDLSTSPWSESGFSIVLENLESFEVFKNKILERLNVLYTSMLQSINKNFINGMMLNINEISIKNFSKKFDKDRRAIVVCSTSLRVLPSLDIIIEGISKIADLSPFDVFQQSSVSIGEPLYVVAETKDKMWCLVLSTICFGWIEKDKIAYVKSEDVKMLVNASSKNGLVTCSVNLPLIGDNNVNYGLLLFGSVLSIKSKSKNWVSVWVPVKNKKGFADFVSIDLPSDRVVQIPLEVTEYNFINLINKRLGGIYGWGGMCFRTDCSGELKGLFAHFGILLPRNSKSQSNAFPDSTEDITSLSQSERFDFISNSCKPFLSLIYVPGHIVLFVGMNKYCKNFDNNAILMYETRASLKNYSNTKRYVLGETAITRLLSDDGYADYLDGEKIKGVISSEHKEVKIINIV